MIAYRTILSSHCKGRCRFEGNLLQPAKLSSLAFCPADSIVSRGSETTDDQYSYFPSAISAYIPDTKPEF
jgi:hypothetical protein